MTTDQMITDETFEEILRETEDDYAGLMAFGPEAFFILKMPTETARSFSSPGGTANFSPFLITNPYGAVINIAISLDLLNGGEWWTGVFVDPNDEYGQKALVALAHQKALCFRIHDETTCKNCLNVVMENTPGFQKRIAELSQAAQQHNATLTMIDFERALSRMFEDHPIS